MKRQPLTNGTLADAVKRLGGIPINRIRMMPPPGTAKLKDVIAARMTPERRLCELVDGILVEKARGAREALWAGLLLHWFWDFLEQHDLGIALGPDATLRLLPGLVRIPDVVFISWDKLPSREMPETPVPGLIPDLAVEVISKTNTPKEMARKLREYFQSGVRLVWYIYPKKQIVEVYTNPDSRRTLKAGQTLDGGEVLPGFTIPVKQLFALPQRKGNGRA